MQPPEALKKSSQRRRVSARLAQKKDEKGKMSFVPFQSLCFLKPMARGSESVNLADIAIVSPSGLTAVSFVVNIACLLAHATLGVWALHRALARTAAD